MKTINLGPFTTTTRPSNGDFEFALRNSQATASFNWHYKDSKFPYTSDHGTGTAVVSDFTLVVHCSVERGETGAPFAYARDTMININHMDITLSGGKHAWLYQMLIAACKGQVVRHVQDDLDKAVNGLVQRVVNSKLTHWAPFFPMSEGVFFDERLDTASPMSWGSNYMTFHLNGGMAPSASPVPMSAKAMPDLLNEKSIQLFFTNDVFQTYFDSYRQKGSFNVKIPHTKAPKKFATFFMTKTYHGLVPWLATSYPNKFIDLEVTVSKAVTTHVSPAALAVTVPINMKISVEGKQVAELELTSMLAVYPVIESAEQRVAASVKFYSDDVKVIGSEGPIDPAKIKNPLKIFYNGGVVPWSTAWTHSHGMILPPVGGIKYTNPDVRYDEKDEYVFIGTDFLA